MLDPDGGLLRGTLDVLILKALTWGPRHGYAVAEWVKGVTDGDLLVEEGPLYTALHRLEKNGWLSSEWGYSENNGDFGSGRGGYKLKEASGTFYAGYGEGPWYVGVRVGAGDLDLLVGHCAAPHHQAAQPRQVQAGDVVVRHRPSGCARRRCRPFQHGGRE